MVRNFIFLTSCPEKNVVIIYSNLAMNPPPKSLDIVEEESEIPEVDTCQKLIAELSVRSSSQGNLVNGDYRVFFSENTSFLCLVFSHDFSCFQIQEPLKPSISPRIGNAFSFSFFMQTLSP